MIKRICSLLYLFVFACPLSAQSASGENLRIVTAGGSITEVVYQLGFGDSVVGVDQSSTYPPEIKSVASIGYWKQLSVEGILSLKPTHVLTWQDAEPHFVLDQLAAMKVNVVALARVPSTPEQLFINIKRIAAELGVADKGVELAAAIQSKLNTVTDKVAQQQQRPKVLFLLSVASGPAQVAGKNTVADGIITLSGGNNVAKHQNYQTYGAEAFIAANPDVIVLTSQALQGLGGMEKLGQIAGIAQTNAWRNQRIVALDQAILLGMGPRIAEAAEGLYAGFYPQ
jgi:iron complex transport system substrate-binding protein